MSTTKRAKGSQLRKPQIKSAIAQLDSWANENRKRIDDLQQIEFTRWVNTQVDEIRSLINAQDYAWAIQSRVRHMVSTFRRMESGEIVAVSACGSSFELKRADV